MHAVMQHVHLHETRVHGKRLGRHIEHDPRSRAFEAEHVTGPIKSITWERHYDPFDQGDVGSCTCEAATGLAMTGPFYKPGRELAQADALALYSVATKLDSIPGSYPPDDTGSSGMAAMRAAKRAGWIPGYRHAFSLSAALAALQKGPVITGVNWYQGFDSPQGDAAFVSISGEPRGGHEVLVYGVDVENATLLLRNSWGSGWGARGEFCWSFETWRTLLKQRGDVTAGVL